MSIKIVYLDDEDEALNKYKTKFETDSFTRDKFEIFTINVQETIQTLLNKVEAEKPELILIDYVLDKPKNDIVIGMSGIPLSTALREKFQEVPIVLFTRRPLFHIENYSSKTTSSVDEIAYKDEVFGEDGVNNYYLYELAKGFGKLRRMTSKNWNDLLNTLNAPEDDHETLKLTNPPIGLENGWSVSQAADWIINTVLAYPGILYDSVNAATFLGITEDEFINNLMQDFFSDAKYSGIFPPQRGLWWRSKLHEIAMKSMVDDEKKCLLRKGFPTAWEREKSIDIERSKCVYSEESPADWVCYVLKKPMKLKYSLLYHPDSRPAVMDEARVSYKAIISTNDYSKELFDSTAKETVDKIIRKAKMGEAISGLQ